MRFGRSGISGRDASRWRLDRTGFAAAPRLGMRVRPAPGSADEAILFPGRSGWSVSSVRRRAVASASRVYWRSRFDRGACSRQDDLRILSVDRTGMACVVSLRLPRYGRSAGQGIRSSAARGRARGKTMNLPRRILDLVARRHSATSDVRLRISNLTRQVELAHCVDVADHSAKRRKGLLGRAMLSAGEGLWIVPCESVHTFGMQFPIDLVYLDGDKRVKKVRNDVPPWRISACLSAYSVLELASGSIRRTGTKPGDRLEFSSALALNDRRTSPDALAAALRCACRKIMTRSSTRLTHRRETSRPSPSSWSWASALLAFLLTIGVICAALLGRDAAGTRDFVSYWASGQLLVHHANPYDGNAILSIERSGGGYFPSRSFKS